MNQQPLVSVIIPTYNRAEYVKKAVESVLNQTYKNIEIIVVDGSQNNETERALQPYLIDSRIKYIYQEERHNSIEEERGGNIAKARNKAIKLAIGKYIASLDDDDFWCDEKKLEKQVQFLEQNPDYVSCGGGSVVIQERNPKKLIFVNLPPEKDGEIREKMFGTGVCAPSSLLFRKDAWKSVGGYNEGPIFTEDFEFALKLGTAGKLYNFQEYFVCAWIWASRGDKVWRKIGRERRKYAIRLMKKYNHIYPNSHKAIFVAWLEYFYLFLPFNKFLRLLAPKIKKIISCCFSLEKNNRNEK